MHDLVAAQDILNTSLAVAKRNKLKKIEKIVVRLGKRIEHNEEIKPKNLKYNFDLIRKNTIAEKAKLEVVKGTGRELSIAEVSGSK